MKSAVEIERFSGSILIAKNGKPLVSKSYGMANVEHDVPNTPDAVFRLASVSKQFTATAIMMLQERGKLKVTDYACAYLAECPEAWRPITIHHLLTMTHGIPSINVNDIGALKGLPIPMDQWFQTTAKKPLEFTPGEKFKYANAGYAVLGLIIERASGKSYGEFLQDEILRPLGMHRSGYEDPIRIIKNRATGYKQLQGDAIENVPYREIIRMYAAGGVFSTTEDLLLWDRSFYTNALLSKKSIDAMCAPFRDMVPGRGYAYGLWSSEMYGRRRLAHGGNATGFILYFARYPEDRVTVIVLSNNQSGSSGKINDVLAAIVFGENYDMPKERGEAIDVDPAALNKFIGEYKSILPEVTYTITREDGKVMLLETGYPKHQIFPKSQLEFFSKTFDMQIKFALDAKGEVAGFIAHSGDDTLYPVMEGKKVK